MPLAVGSVERPTSDAVPAVGVDAGTGVIAMRVCVDAGAGTGAVVTGAGASGVDPAGIKAIGLPFNALFALPVRSTP
jgi:hypothetical protein